MVTEGLCYYKVKNRTLSIHQEVSGQDLVSLTAVWITFKTAALFIRALLVPVNRLAAGLSEVWWVMQ